MSQLGVISKFKKRGIYYMIYGYCRVSTQKQFKEGNSLEAQERKIKNRFPICEIYKEQHTGKTLSRPVWDELKSKLKKGDLVATTKADRFGRNLLESLMVIKELDELGVTVVVLEFGEEVGEFNSSNKLMFNIRLAFAEYERELIVERMAEGKAIARQNPNYREGRKPTYSREQISHALELLESHSYRKVEAKTGISKSTLIRAKNKLKIDSMLNQAE